MRADPKTGKTRIVSLQAYFSDIIEKGQKIDHNVTQHKERRY